MIEKAVIRALPHSPVEAASETDRVRVLVVDDDERNLMAVRSILDETADVVTASSGAEALRELLRGNFAVILLDVIMPEMDGYETATLIRGREQTRHIPIIFLSAINKDEPHLMRGYSMGAADYVFKPVDPLVLRSKVRVFVDLFRMSRDVEEKAKREKALLDENLRIQAERLQAERSLRATEERLAAIVASLPLILYLEPVDASPRVPQFVSGNFAAVTGFEFEEVERNPDLWLERVHPDDQEKVVAALEARSRDGAVAMEYRWKCANGTYKHFLDRAVLLDAPGQPAQFAGTLLDISERKQLEDQLLQAQKMDALGQLTGGIAHDFNNLLSAVISGVNLLERRLDLAEEDQKICRMTKQAALQGVELVRRMLAFSRSQRLEPTRIDMGQLAADVKDLLAHTLGGRVSLDWEVADKTWKPFADRSQLQLAVMNLAINARDAMPEGGRIRISVRNRRLKADNEHGVAAGDYVAIAVKDEGVGMSDDILAQVMQPFFTTKESGKGTGLGLSMVYGFARQSGGTIDIESAVGEGTTVQIWLPRSTGTEEVNASPDEPSAAEQERFEEDVSILLVDDHDGVREATEMVLRELGASVVALPTGEAVLKELRRKPHGFDIIVTDYAMPGMAGDEVIRRGREIAGNIAAVIVSGHANPQSLVALPPRTILLNKPFTPAKLLRAISKSRKMVAC